MKDELNRLLATVEGIDGKVDDLRERTTRLEAQQQGLRDASEQRHGDNRLVQHQIKEQVEALAVAQATAATELRECRHDVRELKTASAAYLTTRDMAGRDHRLEALEREMEGVEGKVEARLRKAAGIGGGLGTAFGAGFLATIQAGLAALKSRGWL